MNNKAKIDLILDLVREVLWLAVVGGIYLLIFQKLEGFIYGTLGFEGNSFWTLVVGVTSYHGARGFNKLYYGAFDSFD